MNNRRLKNQSLQAASSLEGNRNFLFPLDPNFRAILDGGKSHIFFMFTPNPGEIIQFDGRIFFKWVGSTTNSYWCRFPLKVHEPFRLRFHFRQRGASKTGKVGWMFCAQQPWVGRTLLKMEQLIPGSLSPLRCYMICVYILCIFVDKEWNM